MVIGFRDRGVFRSPLLDGQSALKANRKGKCMIARPDPKLLMLALAGLMGLFLVLSLIALSFTDLRFIMVVDQTFLPVSNAKIEMNKSSLFMGCNPTPEEYYNTNRLGFFIFGEGDSVFFHFRLDHTCLIRADKEGYLSKTLTIEEPLPRINIITLKKKE